MKDNERGAIVVEASISLTTFIFLIYTILSIINICFAQAKIGVAINCAAKEISQYSYLYSLTGINDMKKDAYDKGELANGAVDDVVSGVEAIFSEIAKGQNGSIDPSSAYETGKNAYNSIKSGVGTVAEDPSKFILSAAYSAGSDLFDDRMGDAAAALAKNLVKKNLVTSSDGNCESLLKYCGIVPVGGSYFNGLNFEKTEIFAEKTNEIRIAVSYEIRVIRLLDIDITYKFEQCGRTEAWSIR